MVTTPRFAASVAVTLGLVAGLGTYTFWYAKGSAYLRNDPEACAACHIMQPQLDGWVKGSHRAVATCNDCHTPHHPVGKWLVKAANGYSHSLAFTTGRFHEPIAIKDSNRAVTEATCRHCHEAVVHAMDMRPGVDGFETIACTKCHAGVGHGP